MSESNSIIFSIGTIIISAFVAFITGDLAVERAQRKQHHSLKMMETGKRVSQEWEKVFPLESNIDFDSDTYVNHGKMFEGIHLGKFLLEHIKSGYPEINNRYNKFMKEYTNIIELDRELRVNLSSWMSLEVNKIELPSSSRPYKMEIYFNSHHFVTSFWCAMKDYIENGTDFLNSFRIKSNTPQKTYHISWGKYNIADTLTEADANYIKQKTEDFFNTDYIRDNYSSIVEAKVKYWDARKEFLQLLEEELDCIEVGNVVKGHCSACPNTFPF